MSVVADARRVIQEAMKAAGVSQSELARRAGFNRGTLNEFLVGRRDNIELANLDKIMGALGVKVSLRWEKR